MSLKNKAKQVQKAGSKNSTQDSVLAHISPLEAMMLKARGGSGRTDPKTGLPHFDDGGDAAGDYGGWGSGGLGGLGDAGAGVGGETGYGNSYGGDPGDGFGGYGGWGDSGDLGGLGDTTSFTSLDNPMSPTDWNSAYGNYEYNPAAGIPEAPPGVEGNDFFSRLAKVAKQFTMNKAMNTVAQAVPGINMALPSISNAVQAYANDQPPDKAFAAGLLGTIAAPAEAPVQALVGLANLFGANLNIPSMAQSFQNANFNYKGVPAGASGFGTSTTGQQGTGFDNILNGAATAGGLYSLFRNYQNANNQASSLGSLFGPNSPYATQLKQSLERRDAAAGRRSQYGPREVELQAKLAAMANQISPNVLAARQYGDQSLMRMLGMMTSANKLGVFDPVKGWLGSMFGGGNSGGFSMPSTPYDSSYTPSENYFSTGFGG